MQVYCGGGKEDRSNADNRVKVSSYVERLDRMVDERFFADLQSEFLADPDQRAAIRSQWMTHFLVPTARESFDAGITGLPCTTVHRYEKRATAANLFSGRIYRELLQADDEQDEGQAA